jgi:hypothetical protein
MTPGRDTAPGFFMRERNALPPTPYIFDRKGEPSHAVSEGQGNPAGRPPGSRNAVAMAVTCRVRRQSIARGDIWLRTETSRLSACAWSGCCRPRHEPVTCDLPALDTAADAWRRPAPLARSRAAISRSRRRLTSCWVVDLHLRAPEAPPSKRLARLENVRRRRAMASNGRTCRPRTQTVPSPRDPGVPGSRLVLRRGRGHTGARQ